MNNQSIARQAFDYNALPDKATRATLRQEATAIKAAVKRTHDNIIEIGNRLHTAKEVVGHGDFLKWIDAEFGMGRTMALNFMRAAIAFSNTHFSADLGLSQTAIFTLAAPSVSDETRSVALEMAASGDLKTTADAKALIEAAKPPKVSNSRPLEETSDPVGGIKTEPEQNSDDGYFDQERDPRIDEEAIEQFREDGDPFQNEEPPTIASPVQQYERDIEERAANATIVHDTLTPAKEATKTAPKPEAPTDEEWLQGLPIFRVLKEKQHRAIVLRRALLDWRRAEKAINAYSRAIASAESVKSGDNNFFARAFSAPRSITTPDNWGICAPCAGNGCTRCGQGGFEMSGGIDPRRVEAGEVEV